MNKLLSGRYLLTIAVAFVFVWSALSKLLSPAEIVAVVMFVFQAYFNKNREEIK